MNGFNTYINSLNNLNEIQADIIDTYKIDTSFLNGISSTVISYLSNVSSDIQNQLNELSNSIQTTWTTLIQQPSNLSGNNTFIQSTFTGDITMTNYADITMGYGMISQNSGAAQNTLGRTRFNNGVTLSNVTQTTGTTTLLDTNIGVITQGQDKYITQSGTSSSPNNLRDTYISNLVVTNTLTIPSSVTLPSATYNGDIIMNNASIIQNDTSGNELNQFVNSDFIGDIYADGNFTMTNDNKSSVLKNVSIQGNNCNIASNIIQSSGDNSFLDSTFSNIDCSGNILTSTLNTSLISNSEFNTLNNIDTTQTIQNQLNTLSATDTTNYNSLNDAITTNYNTIQSQISTINSKDVSQDNSISALIAKNVVYDASFTSINNSLSTINTKNTSQDNSIASLNSSVTSINNSLSTINTINSNQDASLNILFTKSNGYDASFNALSTASISIGTVTTLDSDENATASITGTIYNSVLNLGLVKGEKGDTGPQGNTGAKGDTGARGATGPQGEKGDTGASGDSTAATVSAGIAAASATAAAASAGASAVSAAASAASAAAAEASVAELLIEINALKTRVTILEEEMDAQKQKTFYITNVNGVTQISSTLECSALNVDGIINSGGNINIESGSALYANSLQSINNNITIGNLTSLIYINNVLYNPYSNLYFNSNGIKQSYG